MRVRKLLYPDYVQRKVDWTSTGGLRNSLRSLVRFRENVFNLREGHIRFVSELAQVEESRVEACLADLNGNTRFFEDLERRYISAWPGRRLYPYFFETNYPKKGGSVFFQAVTMYLLARVVRPETVVETGGASGKSTAFILRALEDNGQGKLITLELNPEDTERLDSEYSWWPRGQPSCFLVPDDLRDRLDLRLGDARVTLPKLTEEIDCIDLFRHDSDHSYEHMLFEFRAVWPTLRDGAILVSDDIRANASFYDFCREAGREPVVSLQSLGGIRK